MNVAKLTRFLRTGAESPGHGQLENTLGRLILTLKSPRTRLVSLLTPSRGAWLLIALLITIIALTAKDYGIAWDDAVQTQYGRLALEYFLSGGANRAAVDYLDLRFYGPLVELPIAALNRLAPGRLLEIRHLVCAAIGLLVVPPLLRFGSLLGGARGQDGQRVFAGGAWLGLLAATLLWTMPRYYGHAFLNSKDIPFAVGMTGSMAMLAGLFARQQFRWSRVLTCGLLMGLTTAIRPGGWMLLGPYYFALCGYQDWFLRKRGARRRTVIKQGAMLLVAWTVMVLPWPWAHESPVTNPIQAIRMASKFHIVVPVLFEGTVFSSEALPRGYLAKFIGYTTPPLVLLLAAVGAMRAMSLLREASRPRSIALFALLMWIALPIVLFAMMRPNAYDGLRHFLFVLPALALLAAMGVATVCQEISRYRLTAPIMSVTVLAAAILPQVFWIVQLHPYQQTYFNAVSGGMDAAHERFETDYWLTSYGEAMMWIRENTESDDLNILVAANEHSRWCAEYFGSPQTQVSTTLAAGQLGELPETYDYYIGTTRCGMADNFPDTPTVHTVGRRGMTFAVIKSQNRQ